jgi:hypothetical protein
VTQRQRIEKRLREHGSVRKLDFLAPNVCDGGKPIWGVAQRINEMRDDGFKIKTDILENGTAVWSLIDQQTVLPVAA